MKNSFFILLILALSSQLFIGCQKEPASESPGNFVYNGREYSLNKGYIENYGLNGSAYSYGFSLLSSGLVVKEASGKVVEISGKGQYISFKLFSSSATILSPGIYTFNTTTTAGSFNSGYVGIGINTSNITEGLKYSVSEGIISIVKDVDGYQLAFSGKCNNGKILTVSYVGPVTYYDYSTDAK